MIQPRVLVLDASTMCDALVAPRGLRRLKPYAVKAPALLITDCSSILHEAAWRGIVPPERARDQLGLAKTCDAEYVALARRLGSPLVTADLRLAVRARQLVQVLEPAEI